MSDRQPLLPLDGVAQKWRALAERRRAHFVDLLESGRWKHYYSEEQFLARLREAIRVSDRWAVIAPPPAAVDVTTDGPAAAPDETDRGEEAAAAQPSGTAQRSAA